MAVTTIGVEIRASAPIQRLVVIRWINKLPLLRNRSGIKRRQRLSVVVYPMNQSQFAQSDKLVVSIGARAIQLFGLKCQGVFRPTAVARQALGAAVELPGVF